LKINLSPSSLKAFVLFTGKPLVQYLVYYWYELVNLRHIAPCDICY